MSVEAAVLGLLSAVRSTPLAIVYGFLLTGEPQRLLAAYITAGAVVSVGLGLVVVAWFDVSAPSSETSTLREVIDLVIGVGALCYASGYASGRIKAGPRRGDGAAVGRLTEWLRRPSVPIAAAAGAGTNLPGLFYLAGLVAILQTQPTPANAVFQVAVYNLLRFAAPLAALVAVVFHPVRTRTVTDTVYAWGRRHSRRLVIAVIGTVGLFLTVKGLLGLWE